ncbi:HET-domain-containing protein [Xylaria sp. CBS 124048]|nr:HET-domain-containing protein [Xylaria sp. CBS 124048]
MESCSVCRNLAPLPGPSGGFIAGGQGIDLAKSSPNCRFCFILWEGLSNLCVEEDPERLRWIALRQDKSAFRLQYISSVVEEHMWPGLHFYTRTADAPLSEIFIPCRDLEPDTGCDIYLSQVQGWVRECEQGHDDCRERLSTTLPTRVLDVSRHEEFVFLYEPEETQEGSYVTLSHVWGGEVPIRTMTESISRFKNGIRLDSLPKTFRDAVFVTRLLKCQYLWIDSLCIIQDSREDWAREAARMADVYGNSYLTIAAVWSSNSNGGLFSKHESTAVKHTIRYTGEGDKEVVIDVRPALEHEAYYRSSPLGLPPNTGAWILGRAWCYQEYMLSPRVLLFTDLEILWVCLSQKECSCGEYSRDTPSMVTEGDLKVTFDKTLRDGSAQELRRLWTDVVYSYSLKSITFDTDRLPALAGIAHRFSGKGMGRYVNGLWEPTLVADLFWETTWVVMDEYQMLGRRSGDSSMPSWSWASVSAPIDIDSRNTMIRGLEVIEISFEPDISGPLTDISARTLTLRGVLIDARVWWRGAGKQDIRPAGQMLTVDGMNETSWLLDVATEVDCGPDKPMDVYILCGIKGPGLVLDLIKDSSDTYKRLGKIKNLPSDRSKYAVKTIRLV